MRFDLPSLMMTLLWLTPLATSALEKPQLVALTDIGGDPNDRQSLAHLMVLSNEFEIKTIIAQCCGNTGGIKASHHQA